MESNEYIFQLTQYKKLNYQEIYHKNNNKFTLEIKEEKQKLKIKNKYEFLKTEIEKVKKIFKQIPFKHNIFVDEQLDKRIKNYELILQNNKYYEEEIQIFNLADELNGLQKAKKSYTWQYIALFFNASNKHFGHIINNKAECKLTII